ncbi:MAG: DEAD/DEAH box helicase family protein [Candidatus Gracilibacteria bacterium]|nr:DEAD/DEAH box helicase family protein [Candidatus Gracilibacteria bacterium]MDD2909142.1 DEAD/DEAH box helicase family protein [Candidatus Gracilibacteria bacterium]
MRLKEELSLITTSKLNNIYSRFSLRTPQKEALEVLAFVIETIGLNDNTSLSENLSRIKEISEGFNDFHFDFPSFCFALATGVGKTRLMGAMIYFLHKTKGYNNFFVLAPNLTIYEKLIKDFTYGSEKYVFKGLGDFDGSNPRIVDGNNYSQININDSVQELGFVEFGNEVTINIFNISKFNSKSENTKLRSLSEYIGKSYFDYLKSLPDLVVLMDESHRYRANSSSSAINELNPVLGLEFTATPSFNSKRGLTKFENIAYQYNLANAIKDGYVKVPAVATRRNFDITLSDEEKDFIKLQDGIYLHENTKIDLELYASNRGVKLVKPFVMISTIDQKHADAIEEIIKSDKFFGGQYRDKVIKIYSGSKAEDKDEAIRKLLEVEQYDNPVEIVVQVMMLKEGWDVNNLYTIVPLRAFAAEILTEQTIGRGLRLPYGQKTGDESVDRLTIVAHDAFQKIVDIANNPNSLIKNIINLDDRTGFLKSKQLVLNTNIYDDVNILTESNPGISNIIQSGELNKEEVVDTLNQIYVNIIEAVKQYETFDSSEKLQSKEVHDKIIEEVRNKIISKSKYADKLSSLGKISEESLILMSEQATIIFLEDFVSKGIDIPEVQYNYGSSSVEFDKNFLIDCSFIDKIRIQDSQIVVQDLSSNERKTYDRPQILNYEGTIEDYLLDIILQIDELDYETYSDFIYNNVYEVISVLREKFPGESDEILLSTIAGLKLYIYKNIESQLRSEKVMQIHKTDPKIELIRGFRTLKAIDFDAYIDGGILDFHSTGFEKTAIRNYVFRGFRKCISKYVKFDSDTERRFSSILENGGNIIKWMKPPSGSFKILYRIENDSAEYLPDFVVETLDAKYIIEIKASNEVDDKIVLAKADAAKKWCNDINGLVSGKKWKYLLFPHDIITEDKSLDYLISISL